MVSKILTFVGIVMTTLLFAMFGIYFMIFGGQQKPHTGPSLGAAVHQIPDGFSTLYLFDIGQGHVALIDAGNDIKGAAVLKALSRLGKNADSVAAIFISHAHPDHSSGVGLFPHADIYAMQDEVALAAGKENYQSPISRLMGQTIPKPFQVNHPLHDGETVEVGTLKITAFQIPGHTLGSAAYLANQVVFLGDAAGFSSSHDIRGPVWLFSHDSAQGLVSLKRFYENLKPRLGEIEYFTTSHSGTLSKEDAVRGFEKLRKN